MMIKIEDSTTDAQFSSTEQNNNYNIMSATSCFEKVSMNDHQKAARFKQTNDLSQTIGLFGKYLHAKAQHNLGKTNMEESEAIKRKSLPTGYPLLPPMFGCNLTRRPSFLEEKLLPRTGGDSTEANSADAKSSKSQLTIFYGGIVNVYDNIPVDKAEAIMHLAGESNLSKPLAKNMPKTDRKTTNHLHNLQSVCKLKAELPIARKISLHHFLEKRRQRIVNKSPYVPLNTNKKKKEPTTNINDGSNINQSLSLSTFPSRLGYFFPVSTQQN